MREKSVITRTIEVAGGVFAPGHLGELTQIVDFALVDAVLEETGTRERRLRLLPSRVVVYLVLALALFEHHSYRAVWGKLVAALDGLALVQPAVSSLSRARRRVGAAPLRRLFETLAGPVAHRGQTGEFYRGLRTVAVDGTLLHVPDDETITWHYPKRAGERLEFGYPLLRLVVLVECGTRALLTAAFGPESEGELSYARQLLDVMDRSMLLLADAGFDAAEFLRDIQASTAQFLVRSSARRIPTPTRRLPDGSYLARLGYGVLPALLTVRVIEAQVTVTLTDGTSHTEQWRLLTSLLDCNRHPAHELIAGSVIRSIEIADGVSLAGADATVDGADVKNFPASVNGLSSELLEELAVLAAEKVREGGLRLMGEGGLLPELAQHLMQAALEAEMDQHLAAEAARVARSSCLPPCVIRPRIGRWRQDGRGEEASHAAAGVRM